ncbi:GTPase ObgE [bacterium DOLJORAL78_65_58]|nr:MAG: GTPase ObgE [bacterium DOLZORAL124_64_63]PIE75877.1 MAG: GTPase ObgE [bacterium DOLJORAL78_65_58]
MFLDIATITLESGRGGDGCVSTRREKFVSKGGPDGGNGGQGGSVYLEASKDLSTLLDFRYRRTYRAGAGKPGGGQRMTGADGESIVLKVPCGTSVLLAEDGRLLGDLLEDGQRLRVAPGGRGGKGNWEFRNPRNQTPMKATEGQEGRVVEVRLELKLIADIGLVGEPNAGKSTLLSAITAARPKVADYPFTTLVPNLGIVDLGDFSSCTMADIPGLIEGAAEGKGLGHEFLRHVERTRALLLLVDPTYESPRRALDVLRAELVRHGNRLAELPFAVVVTKQDVLAPERSAEVMAEARAWCEEHGGVQTLQISSVARKGLEPLRHLIRRLYRADSTPES